MRIDLSGFAARRLAALGVALMFCCAGSGWAAVRYVDAGASSGNNGSSWANAYTDLQAALAAADWGDEIWVATGTYKPTSGTDRDISFVMTPRVAIYGGFAGTETDRTQRDWEANETILSGDIGVAGDDGDNTKTVVIGGYMGTLDGVTVTGGKGAGVNRGGGMYNKDSSPTVTNCTFSGNSAGYGGGMYNCDSSPTVTNCTFSGNSAAIGGGMYNGDPFLLNDTSPTVTNCTFSGNSANMQGGGMYNSSGSSPTVTNCTFSGNSTRNPYSAPCSGGGMVNNGSSPTVTNCTFSGNSASGSGGGMLNSYSSPTVTNCTFSGNSANFRGGGMSNKDSSPAVTNCTFSGNSASDSGGGMYNDSSSPRVTNSIFSKNKNYSGFDEIYNSGTGTTFSHCAIRGSGGSGDLWDTSLGTDGGGNIMSDPLFTDMENPAGPDGIWMTADDGLALGVGSPCIDAGDAASAPATDILGNLRVGTADMGAYEFGGGLAPPDPPTQPVGQMVIGYTLTAPSTGKAGETATYTYHWTSDQGDDVTHGPQPETSDMLKEMNLVQAGEIWTLTVTPHCEGVDGEPATARIRILDTNPENGIVSWVFYH